MTSLTPAVDTSAADWIVDALGTFAESVTSLVPSGFEAYLRVFHPAYHGREPFRIRVSWAEIAAASGKKAHPAMQSTAFTGSDSLYDALPGIFDDPREVGTLPLEIAGPIAATLARHTATPDKCWFAVWNGFAFLRDGVRLAPSFHLPHRDYHLFSGSVEAMTESVDSTGGQSPNLTWSEDHAWCVATEIDLNTTYIACDNVCSNELIALPEVEAFTIDPASGITINSDLLNLST